MGFITIWIKPAISWKTWSGVWTPLKCLHVLFLSPLKNVQLFTKKDQALRLFGLPSANGCLLVVATSTHFKDEKMTKNRLWESQKWHTKIFKTITHHLKPRKETTSLGGLNILKSGTGWFPKRSTNHWTDSYLWGWPKTQKSSSFQKWCRTFKPCQANYREISNKDQPSNKLYTAYTKFK